jgi:hypothetical protein
VIPSISFWNTSFQSKVVYTWMCQPVQGHKIRIFWKFHNLWIRIFYLLQNINSYADFKIYSIFYILINEILRNKMQIFTFRIITLKIYFSLQWNIFSIIFTGVMLDFLLNSAYTQNLMLFPLMNYLLLNHCIKINPLYLYKKTWISSIYRDKLLPTIQEILCWHPIDNQSITVAFKCSYYKNWQWKYFITSRVNNQKYECTDKILHKLAYI